MSEQKEPIEFPVLLRIGDVCVWADKRLFDFAMALKATAKRLADEKKSNLP